MTPFEFAIVAVVLMFGFAAMLFGVAAIIRAENNKAPK